MKLFLLLLGMLPVSLAYAGACDFIQFNRCESCDDRFAFVVGSEEACTFLCPNRETNNEGSGSHVLRINCALKECPKEFPYKSPYGSCFATQYEAEVADYEAGEEYAKKENTNDDAMDTYPEDVPCPADKPLRRWDGLVCPAMRKRSYGLKRTVMLRKTARMFVPTAPFCIGREGMFRVFPIVRRTSR